jgi:hypothetical protein
MKSLASWATAPLSATKLAAARLPAASEVNTDCFSISSSKPVLNTDSDDAAVVPGALLKAKVCLPSATDQPSKVSTLAPLLTDMPFIRYS